MPPLENLQHEKFCVEFLVDFNATQAAIRAGYSAGEKNGSASTQSARLLGNAGIMSRIKELHEDTIGQTLVSIKMVLEEFKRIACCDVGEAFNEDGSPKLIKQIPTDVRKCISAYEAEEIYEQQGNQKVYIGVLRKVKFWDKNKGLEMIGRYLKMWSDKIEVNATLSLESLVMGVSKSDGRTVEPTQPTTQITPGS